MKKYIIYFIFSFSTISACDKTLIEDSGQIKGITDPEQTKSASGEPASTQVWNVSGTLVGAYHQYFDVPVWNINGSKMFIRLRSNRDLYMVSSLTETPAKVNVHSKMGRKGDNYVQWDMKDPEVFYYAAYDIEQTGTYLVKQKLTGEQELIFIHSNELRLAVPHPNGEHLLLHPPLGKTYNSIIYTLSTGTTKSVKMPGPVHRARFTKHPDLSLFINLHNVPNGGSWIVTTSGVSTKFWEASAGHPDWSPDGERMSFFGGGFHVIDRQGNLLKYRNGPNGHQSWSYDGSLIFADMNNDNGRIHGGYIISINPLTLELIPFVPHNSIYTDDQATHPHAFSSPDGTKVVFNSNNKSESNPPHVYVVSVKKPAGVIDLKKSISNEGILTLSWEMPEAKELGSVIISSIDMDGDAKEIAEVEGLEWSGILDDSAIEYEVITKERSGLMGTPVKIMVKSFTSTRL